MSSKVAYKVFTDAERKKLIRGVHAYIRKYHHGVVNEETLKIALPWVSLEKLGRTQSTLSNWILVAFGINKNLPIKRPVPVVPGINDGADSWGKKVSFQISRKPSDLAVHRQEMQEIKEAVAEKLAENAVAMELLAKNQKEIKSLLRKLGK